MVMVSISLVVLVVCTALTVDLGRVSTLRRDLQNVADAAALDLVRLVDGRSAGEILADGRWDAALRSSLERNGFEVDGVADAVARLGSYAAEADVFTPVGGATDIPSAVEVEITDRVEYQLAPGGTTTSRSAVASQAATAGIQLGSFAARLDSSQSALLGPLVQDALDVDLIGYRGLAGGRVGLADLAAELGLTVGSPDELLTTEVELAELVAAQAEVLRRGGDVARADLLDALAARVRPTAGPVALGDLVSIAPGGQAAAAAATLDVLELVTTAALVADGDGLLTIPALDIAVPGVAATRVSAQVIESPRIAFGGPGTTVQTAQVRLDVSVDLAAAGLVGARLDLGVQVAPARATMAAVSCGDPQALALDVVTGLVQARASVTSDIAVDLLGLTTVPVAAATGTAEAGTPEGTFAVDFVIPPDAIGDSRPASSGDLHLGDLAVALDVELLPTAQLPVLLRGVLGLVATTAEGVAETVLAPLVATALDGVEATVVRPLLTLLGVVAPGADLTPLAISCTGPRLVG